FLRIGSLLNAGSEGPSQPVAKVSTVDSDHPQQPSRQPAMFHTTPPSTDIRSLSQPRSQPLDAQLGMVQQPLLERVYPASAVEYHSCEPRVVRSQQQPFSVYDNRYWPYQLPQLNASASAFGALEPRPHVANLLANSERNFIPWQRHRRSRACESCHYRKIKCEGEGEGTRCDGCARFNYECTWVPMKKRGPKPKPKSKRTEKLSAARLSQQSSQQSSQQPSTDSNAEAAALTRKGDDDDYDLSSTISAIDQSVGYCERGQLSSSTSSVRLTGSLRDTPEDIMRRFYSAEVSQDTRDTIIYYLDYFYGVCPIFHPATLVRRVVYGEVDPLLIQAMRASAARVITKNTGKYVDVDKAIEDVQQKLLLGLDSPSLDFVRAVVLLASLKGGECKFMSYNSLSCLASSLVTRLGWHTIDLANDKADMSWDDWINTELKRRTFWVAYEIDSYLGLLSDRPMTISESRLYVSAPRSDHTWDDISVLEAANWPARYQTDMPASKVLETGYVLQTFVEGCSLTALTSRINTFLWDAKISFSEHSLAGACIPKLRFLQVPSIVPMQRPTRLASLFEYPRFVELDRMLSSWRENLVRADDMKHLWKPEHCFATFGSLEHRHFIMRIRYFCLYAYSVPLLHILHFANRPSFFGHGAESGKDADSLPSPASSLAAADSIENAAIREMLSSAFSDLLNDGILAYDIVDESWSICLEAVHDIIAFIDRNSDIPLDRCDQVMPFCLFTSMTVLIRQIRRCRKDIEARQESHSKDGIHAAHAELSKNVGALRRLWAMLKGLDLIWRTDGMELLLRTMQVEEVANLISDMSL
ncbi:hypothetical protein GGF42_000837, partial [Coemansia sp. RSA 2424]